MKKICFLISLILGVGAFASSPARVLEERELSPTEKFAAELLARARRVDGTDGKRWKTEGVTLHFEGEITKGECARFRAAAGETRTLIVNSGGGDAYEGLCIGEAMRELGFDRIIVDGLCVSSCANYLFLAAPTRIIKSGFVGYHGNATAFLHQTPIEAQIRQQLVSSGLTPEQQDELIAKTLGRLRESSEREQKFFAAVGVSQDLFERTQAADKGVPGGEFEFLLPKPATFLRYGILNVEGVQEFKLSEDMGVPSLLD